MKTITTSISNLFHAISKLEDHNFIDNKEFFQRNKIKIKNEYNEWIDVIGMIKKRSPITSISFNNGEILRVANKHLIQTNVGVLKYADQLSNKDIIIKSSREKVEVSEITKKEDLEYVYDFEVNSKTHLYQDASGFVHHNTELAKSLCNLLFSNEDALIRIDMSEYQEKHTVSRMIGAPPGYVGYDEGGDLTEAVRRRPYSVILLDEIEKAHPDIFNVLLQVLDDGRLTDSKGRVVNFKNTIVIMTSNLGSHIIQENYGEMTGSIDATIVDKTKDEVLEFLKQSIRPEFLNRIDERIVFSPLNMDNIKDIVGIHMKKLITRVEEQGYKLSATEKAIALISKKSFDPQFGARPVRRTIQKDVLDMLSLYMLKNNIQEGDSMILDTKGDELVVRMADKDKERKMVKERAMAESSTTN